MKIIGKLFIVFCIYYFMTGQYTKYYLRIGKGKKKRYQCMFESCGNYIVKSLSGIYSHIERTHAYEIRQIKRKNENM